MSYKMVAHGVFIAVIVFLTVLAVSSGSVLTTAFIALGIGFSAVVIAHYRCAFRHGHTGVFFWWDARKAEAMELDDIERTLFYYGISLALLPIVAILVTVLVGA